MSPVRLLATDRGTPRELIAFLGIFAFAVIPLVAYLIWSGYQVAIDDAETTTRNYAAILEARLDATLRRADATLLELSRTVPVAALSRQAVPRYARELNTALENHLVNFKEVGNLLVADRHGDVLYSSGGLSTSNPNVSDRSYFLQLRDKPEAGPVFSEVVTGRVTKRQVIVMARALTDARGSFSGVVIAPLELEYFQTLLESLAIGPHGLILLRRSDHHEAVVRRPHLDREINIALNAQHPVVKSMAAGRGAATLHLVAQSDGIERIFSYQALERYPFYVNVGVSRDDVLAEWRTRSRAIGVLGLLLLGLLAGLLFRLSRSMAREAQTTDALTESESNLRKMLDAMLEGCQIVGFDWRYHYLNDAAQTHNRRPNAELLGKTMMECWPGITATEAFALEQRCMVQRTTHRVDSEFVFPDGGKGWFSLIIQPVPQGIAIYSEDVTERKQAEEALRLLNLELEAKVQARTTDLHQANATLVRTEEEIRSVVENIADGIITIDERGIVASANRAAERLFGYAAAEMAGQNIKMLMPEPYQSRHDGYLEHYRTTGEARVVGTGRTVEVTGRRKDGSTFPLELAVSEMQLDNERRFTGIVRDITARKQVEVQIARTIKELADFKAALDTHAIVVTTDAYGNITYVNDKFCAISKYARDELIGQNHRIVNSGHHPQAFFAELWQTIASGDTWKGEIRNRAKDGTIYWVDTTIVPFLDEHLKPTQYITIRADITKRKQAEAALSEKEHLLSESQRIAHIGSWLWDLKDGISWSDEMYHIYGVSADTFALNVNSFFNLTYPDDRPAAQAWFRACAAGKTTGEREYRILWPDGTVHVINGNGELTYDAEGRPSHVAGTAQDITARKQAEQALIDARNAADLANSAKDSFLATMSHEIRTPLGGLLGMLELLSLSPLSSEQTDTLQTARDSGRSLLRILNDILDWSKIEEGKLELTLQSTSIAQLVDEVANTYSHMASSNSVTLTQQVDPRLSATLTVDPLRLSQVLNNFVSNAVKFSHGGRVELRAELLERLDGAEQVRFSVKDTGIGIDPEAQQRLFRSYGQASADTARMYGGTGLGLAICRRLADLLDGRIDVESAPGHGSTFSITLTLPIAEAAPDAGKTPNRIAAGASVLPLFQAAAADVPRVLVVDDHPINRKLLARQIELLGLCAETAENGEAALAQWRAGRYAVVITDCHMPVMDGYALTRAIRGIEVDEARSRTPVFAWTANALADEIENCRAAGMDELLVKPADLVQLKTVLAKWLSAGMVGSVETPTAVSPAPTVVPVDVSVLAALVGDDPAVIREFLLDFRASAATIAAELAAACSAGQAAQAEALAHKLKSSARAVGALALGELCAEMETAGKTGQAAALSGVWPRFEAEMAAVDATLADLTALDKETGESP